MVDVWEVRMKGFEMKLRGLEWRWTAEICDEEERVVDGYNEGVEWSSAGIGG